MESHVLGSKRLNIFIGAYGSGKSEVSVNFALKLRDENPGKKILLADLDIVNPFYRSADAANKLGDTGIRVISPSFANSNVDVPALSGEVYSIFDDESYTGVFDIGGEDLGANVLGTMHNRLLGIDYGLYMVINTLRPFTSDKESILQMAYELTAAAKLPISGFINNTNLLEETSESDIIKGAQLIDEVSKASDIPYLATTVESSLLSSKLRNELAVYGEVIPLKRVITYDY